MIDLAFRLGNEHVLVRIDDNTLYLGNTIQQFQLAPFDEKHIHLSKAGVIKEFPDLKNDENWERKSIERFKVHFKSLKTKEAKIKYIVEDLRKHGYTPMYKQETGRRIEKIQ